MWVKHIRHRLFNDQEDISEKEVPYLDLSELFGESVTGSLTGASREGTSNGSQSKSSVGNPGLDLNDPQLLNELGSELDEESQDFGVDGQHRTESREANNKPIIKDISDLQNVADLDTTFAYAIDDSE